MPRLTPFLDVDADAVGRAAIAAVERAKVVVRQLPETIHSGAMQVVETEAVPAVNAALGGTTWQEGGGIGGGSGITAAQAMRV